MDEADNEEYDLPPALIQLGNELRALGEEAMLLEELDGFFAGLLVCPDMVMPGEWLSVVWNGKPNVPAPLADKDHANRVFGLMMQHYNSIAMTLMDHPEAYHPLLPFDETEDRYVWELWASGFGRAIELRPQAWQPLLNGDDDAAAALRGLMTLVDDACSVPSANDSAAKARVTEAPDDIPLWVVMLHEWRLAKDGPPAGKPAPFYAATPVRTGPKTGRNDPCPCGSGKKYKKCCGLN
jgi:uncharacterized protein